MNIPKIKNALAQWVHRLVILSFLSTSLTPAYSMIEGAREDTPLIRSRAPVESAPEEPGEDLPEQVNRFYAALASSDLTGRKCNVGSVVEKVISISTSTTGLIFLYFLGADLIDTDFNSGKIGYILGPVFEFPFACLAYQMQNDTVDSIKQTFDPNWRKIAGPILGCKKIGRGAFLGTMGCLGILMATTAVYYTDFYLRPHVGSAVWVFIVPAFVSNGFLTGLSGVYFFDLMGKAARDYLFKSCKSNINCKRELLSKWIEELVEQLEQDDSKGETKSETERLDACRDFIKKGKITEILRMARKESLDRVNENQESPNSERGCLSFKFGQVCAAVAGAVASGVSSYSSVEATKNTFSYLLQTWFGVGAPEAEAVGQVSGYVGGVIIGFCSGYFTAKSFQALHELAYSCVKKKKKCNVKSAVAEPVKWILAGATVAPRLKVLLDNVGSGAGQIIVMIGTITSTVGGDYFAWQSVPEVFENLLCKKKQNRFTIDLLKKFQEDIGSFSDQCVAALFHFAESGECEPVRSDLQMDADHNPKNLSKVPDHSINSDSANDLGAGLVEDF